MNTTTPDSPSATPAQRDSKAPIIAVSFLSFPEKWNQSSAYTTHKLVIGSLNREGIESISSAPLILNQPFVLLILISVRDRIPALQALQKTFTNAQLLLFVEIAYLDQAELYWRTTHPAGASPFDRYLKPEDLDAAFDQALRQGKELLRFIDSIVSKPETEDPK